MRRLFSVVLLVGLVALLTGFSATTLAATPPKPKLTGVSVRVTLATDTTLRIVTTWGYKTAPPVFPDSSRVKATLKGDLNTRYHYVKWPQQADTSLVPISGYGTFSGFACVAPVKGTTVAAELCSPWTFVRPEPPVPPYDSMSTKVIGLVVRPQGLQVSMDSVAGYGPGYGVGSCIRWQQNNPGLSPWIAVNTKAVSRCMGKDAPVVGQFCVFYTLKNGIKGVTTNSGDSLLANGKVAEAAYCQNQFISWLSEASS